MPLPKRNSPAAEPVSPEPASIQDPEIVLNHEPPPGDPELGRRPLARCLASRLREGAPGDQAFFLHIDGVSGAGKSSFLNLLQDELCAPDSRRGGWHVIRLDAPHVTASGPLWWSLMDAVFRGVHSATRRNGSARMGRIWQAEYAWRFAASHGALYFGVFLAALALLLLGNELRVPVILQLVIGGIATGALYQGFRESLLIRPRPGGKGGHVNLEDVSAHLGALFRRSGAKVAIFLDDLEQCGDDAAPDLLKSCNVLFKDLPVAVVVAADRRWLLKTFEAGSPMLCTAAEPGRSAGYLMLARLFQLSVSLPRVPVRTVARYWNSLVTGSPDTADVAGDGGPGETQRLDHATFLGLARVMDQNPRTMKRFIDAYDVMTLVHGQAGTGVSAIQIAGWTLLCLRWPLLAEYLAERPKEVAHFRYDAPPSEVPDLVRGLFLRPPVVAIMRGLAPDSGFDERTVRALTDPFNNGGSRLGVA